jgi:hypothetical protein
MILRDVKTTMKKHHASGSQKSEVGSRKSEVKGLRSSVIRFLFFVFCLLSSFFTGMISGCASSAKNAPSINVTSNSAETFANDDFDLLEEEYAEQMEKVPDPLEPFNRVMFNVN